MEPPLPDAHAWLAPLIAESAYLYSKDTSSFPLSHPSPLSAPSDAQSVQTDTTQLQWPSSGAPFNYEPLPVQPRRWRRCTCPNCVSGTNTERKIQVQLPLPRMWQDLYESITSTCSSALAHWGTAVCLQQAILWETICSFRRVTKTSENPHWREEFCV